MIDKNQSNEEFKFSDLDVMNPETSIDDEHVYKEQEPTIKPVSDNKDIRRNALIVVGVIFCIMLLYKFISLFHTTDNSALPKQITPVTQPLQPAPTEQPLPEVQKTPIQLIEQKLTAIEADQQTVHNNIDNINSQVNNISANTNDINNRMADLNQTIMSLTAKVEAQSQQLTTLMSPPAIKTTPAKKKVIPAVSYYIQALIPGRAWLTVSNGSTLTIKEGSFLAGYGQVKSIDADKGIILTSSGKVIRFSQQDS